MEQSCVEVHAVNDNLHMLGSYLLLHDNTDIYFFRDSISQANNINYCIFCCNLRAFKMDAEKVSAMNAGCGKITHEQKYECNYYLSNLVNIINYFHT